jgi:uncharacterized protein (UPF0548 family)
MKLSLKKPTDDELFELVREFRSEEFSHQNVGTTKDWRSHTFAKMPDTKVVDGDLWQFRRVAVGKGETDFCNAVAAIRAGVCFDLPWVDCFQQRDFEKGDDFCLSTRAFGIWSSNFCRIVYSREESNDDRAMFSLGVGTLPCHAAEGEERLSISWTFATDEVDFLIGSFSQPRTWLTHLFVLYLRRQQKRFAVEAAQRVATEVVKLRGESRVGSQDPV